MDAIRLNSQVLLLRFSRGFMSRIFLSVLCFILWLPGLAAGCDGMGHAESRLVLGLYDGRREPTPADTRLHRLLELPLNHLGYVVRYLDVSNDRLPASLDPDFAGVVTWFDAPLADPDSYARWAAAARSDCPEALSFIVLGETGLPSDAKPGADGEAYLRRLGLSWRGRSTLLGDFTTIEQLDPALLGYESDVVFRPGRYASLRAMTEADSALRARPSGKSHDESVDLAVLHAPNAYLHASVTVDTDGRAPGQFWIVDPFAMLNRTLSRQTPRPVADVTTLNGRRIYFETVGPEGWLAQAPVRSFDAEPRLGADNLIEALIVPFPDLPVTVSVAIGDLEPAIGGKLAKAGRRAADALFALPHTAVATSGRSLVRRWAAVVDGAVAPLMPNRADRPAQEDGSNRLLAHLGRNLREAFSDPNAPAEPQLSDSLRKYAQDPFSLRAETADAIKALRAMAPTKTQQPLFLWSGDGKPNEDALSAVAEAGATALGGGITKLGNGTSITGLAPFGLQHAGLLQVFHALPGDLGNQGYPAADNRSLHELALLVDRTDHPRRLKPFQLAYSAGTANQFSTRSAIERLKTRALSTPTIPIQASQYVHIVEGFDAIRFQPVGPMKWRVSDRGALETLRFDDAETVSVDLRHSEGVLGARRINDALYVALDPGVGEPLVALTPDPAPSGMIVPQGQIGLVESNLQVVSAQRSICTSRFVVSGWGDGRIVVLGEPYARYTIRSRPAMSRPGDRPEHAAVVVADPSGYATVTVPTYRGRGEVVTLHQNCGG